MERANDLRVLRAREVFKKLLRENSVNDCWKLKVLNKDVKSYMAKTVHSEKVVYLTKQLFDYSDELVKDTLIHEVGHILAPGKGHGKEFKAIVDKLGGNSKYYFDLGDVNTDGIYNGVVLFYEPLGNVTVEKVNRVNCKVIVNETGRRYEINKKYLALHSVSVV